LAVSGLVEALTERAAVAELVWAGRLGAVAQAAAVAVRVVLEEREAGHTHDSGTGTNTCTNVHSGFASRRRC
jgi:hypothetical protein